MESDVLARVTNGTADLSELSDIRDELLKSLVNLSALCKSIPGNSLSKRVEKSIRDQIQLYLAIALRSLGEQLLNLYEAGNRRCKFSALVAHIHNTDVAPFWALSIDHEDPVEGTTIEELYGYKNLQIMMISVLNSVKGNHSDEKLREWWFDLFKKSL